MQTAPQLALAQKGAFNSRRFPWCGNGQLSFAAVRLNVTTLLRDFLFAVCKAEQASETCSSVKQADKARR